LASALAGVARSPTPGNDLAAWVAAHVPAKPFLIAIDNLDECAGVPEVAAFLNKLVDLTTDRVRWVFASRGMPINLPLATWLAYNESDLPITSDDLRLNIDESRQIAAACNVPVTEIELQRILDLTDGWPVAVCLALRHSVGSHSNNLATQTQDVVHAYLEEHVWQSLSSDTQSFLFLAAFLPHFSLSTISLAGFSACGRIMHEIGSQIGLVTKSEGTFKLFRLFRNFIRTHLAAQGEAELLKTLRNAGKLLELMNLPILALERYVDAAAFDCIDRLLSQLNFALIEKGHVDLVERALRIRNPASSPAALALRAALDESRGRVNSAELLYARALEQLVDVIHLRVSVAWRYSLLLYQQGRADAIPLLQELYGRQDLEDHDRAHVAGSLAILLALAGDHRRARVVIDEAITIANTADDHLRARTLGRASTVAFFAGEADRVVHLATEGALIARDRGLHSLAARITTSLSTLHTSSGRIALAASYAREVVEHAEKAGDSLLRARGLTDLLVLEAEIGNEAAIASAKTELSKTPYDGPIGLIGLLVSHGMQSIWRSEFNEAVEFLSAQTANLSPHQHRIRIALWAVAAAAADRTSSLASAVEAYSAATSGDWDGQPMFDRERALSLQYMALALLIAGDPHQAQGYRKCAALLSGGSSAFETALEAVSVRSIGALASASEKLGRQYQGGVAKLILSATERLFQHDQSPSQRLTPAERAVLQAMSDGLSNKAIAALNGRTINTIRSQVSSVLRKLRCDTRGEAVATARRRGLL
jgi:ATP/maltotriose-dependent transcriptional regulator MalT